MNVEIMVLKIMIKIYKILVYLVVNEILILILYFVFLGLMGKGWEYVVLLMVNMVNVL